MSLIKQLIPSSRKFTPASADINWTKVETLVHGPGASVHHGDDNNSAVFACLMAIAFAYPEPPLTVYRKLTAKKFESMPDSPLQMLLDKPTPNNELSIEEMCFWMAFAKHVDGNAYWLKVRSGDKEKGNVIQLWPISPTLMKPVTTKGSGDWISYYSYQDQPNHWQDVSTNNVIHFKLGLDDRDMRLGLAPLKSLVRQISTDDEADRFVDTLLKNYAIPGLVIIPGPGTVLNQTQADDMTDRIQRKYGSDNRGNVAVMSRESKVEQFGFSPKDMDLSILHRIPEERISAVIGVPAIVAGLGAGLDRATYANFKEAREMFTESKLVPLWRMDAAKITASLRPDFTNDRRVVVQHDITDVRALQEDEDAKYKRLETAVGKPWITRNEARTDTGLDTVDGWDEEDLAKAPAVPPAPVVPDPNAPPAVEAVPAGKSDMDRWERKKIKALKNGDGSCEFVSDQIPADIAAEIAAELEDCKTEEEVKYLFGRYKEIGDPAVLAANRLSKAVELLAAAG